MKTNLAITGVGMVTPVGLSALVCLHSVRSGVTRLTVQPYPDRIKEWVVGGSVLTWTPYVRERRLRALAELAFAEAWEQACAGGDPARLGTTAVLLGAPEAVRPGYRFPPAGADLRGWLAGLGLPSPGPVEVFQAGHCSAQVALARAGRLLDAGEVRACVLGVADTQLQIRVTRWHEDFYRLKCAYMTDGLMPGEASCFLVVEKELSARERGAPVLARILSVASDRETATVLTDQPNTAKGLTDAVRAALLDAGVAAKDLDAVWCDLNGESYRAREWAFTEVRIGLQTYTELMHPADCHGDLGAASDANLLGLAALAQATGWANGRPLLVFAGSEGGTRAATVVGPPPAEGPAPCVLRVSWDLPRTLPVDFAVPALGTDEVDYREAEDPPRAYFEWELRQEHLEELASISYQRRGLLQDPTVPWFRAREPEQRLLNHLDAAVAGGPTSVWAVASGLKNPEEGTCFAGALMLGVLPSAGNLTLIDEVLKEADSANLPGIEAGLKHAPPSPALRQQIDSWLGHGTPDVRALAASLAGYRHEGDGARLLPLLRDAEPRVIEGAVGALRRLRYRPAVPEIERLLAYPSAPVQEAAILALLCLGSRPVRDHCRTLCVSGYARPAFFLALCGVPADLVFLRQADGGALADPDVLGAMGILGNVQAVPLLLAALRSAGEGPRVAAGEALELITGAGLREQAVVIEVIDLLEGEVLEDRKEVERVCTSPEIWSAWWDRNAGRFDPRRRWRGGQPLDLGACLAELADGKTCFRDRQRAAWELEIQSGHDVPFEPDWFVPRQRQALEQWDAWLRDNQSP